MGLICFQSFVCSLVGRSMLSFFWMFKEPSGSLLLHVSGAQTLVVSVVTVFLAFRIQESTVPFVYVCTCSAALRCDLFTIANSNDGCNLSLGTSLGTLFHPYKYSSREGLLGRVMTSGVRPAPLSHSQQAWKLGALCILVF